MQAANNFLIVKKEVIKEVRQGRIITTISSAFDFGDEFSGKNIVFAEVIYDNPLIPFLKAGDKIAMNANKGSNIAKDYENWTVITSEQFIAKIDDDNKFIVPPDSVMVKIKKEDKDSLFTKWIKRDDGTKVQLFLRSEPDKMDMERAAIFVSMGTIEQVGENVKGVELNDVAILDYTADNFIDNVLHYDKDGNKFIVIDATTTFHSSDMWLYANRKEVYNKDLKRMVRENPRDQLMYAKGDMDIISPLLGLVRKDKLIAREPYIFIDHKSTFIEKETQSGITYTEQEFILKRKILASSVDSIKKYGTFLEAGKNILVQDADVFLVKINDYTMECMLDKDVLMSILE